VFLLFWRECLWLNDESPSAVDHLMGASEYLVVSLFGFEKRTGYYLLASGGSYVTAVSPLRWVFGLTRSLLGACSLAAIGKGREALKLWGCKASEFVSACNYSWTLFVPTLAGPPLL
jgi:hypothetical protein